MTSVQAINQQWRDKRLTSLYKLVLLLLCLLAFGTRLYDVTAFSFWTDEGLTPTRSGYNLSEVLSNEIIIQDIVTKDTHPPLYYLLIHFTQKALGQTDFAYRFPSVIAGLLLVPLLFQLGRRLGGPHVGLLTALLTAVNPLHIWYAHEARMYTLFVLLAAAMTIVLWQLVARPEASAARLRNYLGLYLLFAGLAFYTHYTAIFLIGAQGIFFVRILWQRGYKKWLLGTAVLASLAMIPVIPVTVPRLFTGAEANYFYVSPGIMLQDVVHGFGLGLTVDFSQIAVKLWDIGAAMLLLIGLIAAKTQTKRAFLLVYLLAAVLGLMLGSLIKPMYQGARHTMVGSPAFLLLLAWGVVGSIGFIRRWPLPTWGKPLLGAIILITTLAGPILSLNNLYNNPDYTKDDFRALIRYVELQAGENDAIVYNNAILLPLHEHYRQRPDVALHASPIYPTFAADTAVPQLEQLAQQYDRLWFVTDPPADKRDEEKLVQRWLDTHLTRIDARNFPGQTTEVKVLGYATAPPGMESLPEATTGRYQPLAIQWESLPILTGFTASFNQPARLPTLWFNLIWTTEQSLSSTQLLRFQLQGPSGKIWATSDQPLARKPGISPTTTSWQQQPYALPLPIGIPPGTYHLLAQPLATREGPVLGQMEPITTLTLAAATNWPVEPERPFSSGSILFGNGVHLAGFTFPEATVRPGHNLPLSLFWQSDTLTDLTTIRYQLDVIAENGDVLRSQTDPPVAGWLTTWPVNTLLQENTGLYFHPETEPGQYRLRWQLLEGETVVEGRPLWRPWRSQSVILGEITVEPWPLVTTLPDQTTRLQADFGSIIQLYGYDFTRDASQIDLTLTWLTLTPPAINYDAFVHLVDAQGQIVTQIDRIPVNGLRPTRGWRRGEVLIDRYTLMLPDNLPSGDYQLTAGLYDSETGIRPLLTYQNQPQPDNQIELTTITLP